MREDLVVASANVAGQECSTSRAFSSCTFHAEDTRAARLRSLVTDWVEEEEGRVYGCNVTSYRTGGRVDTVTWMLRLHREREWLVG